MAQYRCRKSALLFEVTAEDLGFYEKLGPQVGSRRFSLPPPTLGPELRAMRRMAWRNSNVLYRRSCDLTGRSVISGYPASAPYPVYAIENWWGDSWDELESGAEFDFERSFFSQFDELMRRAPRPALMNRDSDNSDYCNYAGENKNCYMANNGSWYNQGCLFGEAYLHCIDCVDCSYLRKSELCAYAVCSEQLYDCAYVTYSHNSSNCYFSFNLRSCRDCFLCCNLRNAAGYVFNRPALPGEIEALKAKMRTAGGFAELEALYRELWERSVHPASQQINCEGCSGEYLANCQNVTESFLVGSVRDGRYLIHCDEGADMLDCSLSGYGATELYYETVSSGAGGREALFCSGSWGSSNVIYCDTVMSCRDCFGCVGLKRKQYCILNKQYAKADYEALVGRIVEHMRRTGEWGEFFPEEIAPHGYNESAAIDMFPQGEAEAVALGYRWVTLPSEHLDGESVQAPLSLDLVDERSAQQTFACGESGKRYRMPKAELALRRKLGIAPSPFAPEIRRARRARMRNQPGLWRRSCSLCGGSASTSFSPRRTETICCDRCYRQVLFAEAGAEIGG